MTPVTVVLDVDGVIIPVYDPAVGVDVERSGFTDWRPQHWTTPPTVPGLHAYSPAMVARLRALSAMPHVTMVWGTTWRERADEVLAPTIGLPSGWPVLDRDMAWDRRECENRTTRSWWKRDAVQERLDVRPGQRLVWVDDDLRFDEDASTWVQGLGERALGISPDTMVGLTTRELDRIERFVLC